MATPQEKKNIEASTQAYLPIKEIKEGVVLMSDHSLKAVVMVSAMNFALKAEDEKNAIIFSYQSFLNSLDFPIQIVASSRQLDLSNYLESVRAAAETQQNPLLKIQSEEYINFVNELLEYSSIMEKRFYVVIPYYPSGVEAVAGAAALLKKQQAAPEAAKFPEYKQKLTERTQIVISGLSGMGLRCAALGTEDLLELYYTLYNPDTAKNQKLANISNIDVPVVRGPETGVENENL